MKSPPPARLLHRLDASIESVKHPVELACLKAERAMLQARLGRHEAAAEALAELHAQFDARPDPAVSAWLGLAEGLNDYFQRLSASARDRLRRSHALAAAARLRRPQALAAAWLAHLDYVQHDGPATARHVSEALDVALDDHHGALARAKLVVAEALHWCERLEDARPWYAAARQHATTDGDEATVAAILHNMAWLRGAHARQALLFGGSTAGDSGVALTSAESSENLERLIQAEALDASVPMLKAQLLTDRGRHEEALALYTQYAAQARGQGLARMSAVFEADMAWCSWLSGDRATAERHAGTALQAMEDAADADDRACAHARLGELLLALGRGTEADHHRDCAQADWAQHREQQVNFLSAIEPITRRYAP
jgi:hypothetical protein